MKIIVGQKMIFEQKLAISKIWAKKALKSPKMGFFLILRGQNLKLVKMTILT